MKYHKTREGEKIKLVDLKLDHLKNIIKWIERKSIEGLTVVMRGSIPGNLTADNMWHDMEIKVYDEEVKKLLNYHEYKDELKRRNKNKIKRDNPFCEACKEKHCAVDLDGSCSLIRVYLKAKDNDNKGE